jgi:hypothetical protein
MVMKDIKFSIQRPSKLYQNWGFGLKINHLAIPVLKADPGMQFFSAKRLQQSKFSTA